MTRTTLWFTVTQPCSYRVPQSSGNTVPEPRCKRPNCPEAAGRVRDMCGSSARWHPFGQCLQHTYFKWISHPGGKDACQWEEWQLTFLCHLGICTFVFSIGLYNNLKAELLLFSHLTDEETEPPRS